MCKSDQIGDFKIINLVVDPQDNNLHHQMAILKVETEGASDHEGPKDQLLG